MKAQHRHELHKNLLADQMGRLVQGMKTAPKSTSILIWVLLLLALGTFAFWQYYSSATQTRRSELWVNFDDATHNPEAWLGNGNGLQRLETLGKDNAGAIAGRTARFTLARAQFQQGQQALTSTVTRRFGIDLLVQARDLYAELENQCPDEPTLAQEALMGVAKAEESLVGIHRTDDKSESYGSLETARSAYQKLANKYPDSVLGKQAAQRAKELDDPTTFAKMKDFYAQYNQPLTPLGKPAFPSSSKDPEAGPDFPPLPPSKPTPKLPFVFPK